MSQKILYIQVIEAREVTSRIPTTTLNPMVTVKYNGSATTKKSTTYKPNKTFWAEIFTYPVDSVQSDFVTFELREKGYHVLSSDWIGEVQLKMRDYDDGEVHLKWFRLGESKLKQHTKRPRGVLLLKIHLTNKKDKPFYKKPVEKVLTYEEWLEWSEAHYAEKFKNSNTSDDYYPKANSTLDSRARSQSVSSGTGEGWKKQVKREKEEQERREREAQGRGRANSATEPGIFSRDVEKKSVDKKSSKLSKSSSEKKISSRPEANSAFDASSSPIMGEKRNLSQSAKNNGSNASDRDKGKMRGFPISPILESPAMKPTLTVHSGDLIDLSDAVPPPQPRNNPFGDTYLSNPFLNMNLDEKPKVYSGNPFLEPGETLLPYRAPLQAN